MSRRGDCLGIARPAAMNRSGSGDQREQRAVLRYAAEPKTQRLRGAKLFNEHSTVQIGLQAVVGPQDVTEASRGCIGKWIAMRPAHFALFGIARLAMSLDGTRVQKVALEVAAIYVCNRIRYTST